MTTPRFFMLSQMHAFLLEFGISIPIGTAVIKQLSTVLAENELPPYLAQLLMCLHAHYLYLVEQITELETALEQERHIENVYLYFID